MSGHPDLPQLPTSAEFTVLEPLADARRHVRGGQPVGAPPGVVLDEVGPAAAAVREEVRASGRPDGVATRALVTQPHPAGFALHRALRVPVPAVWLTDRMVVVTWTRDDGRSEVLLWGPADHERDHATTAMQQLRARLPGPDRLLRTVHGSAAGHVRALGIDPSDVTLVVFDHLHTQDLRRVLGTVGPTPVAGGAPREVPGWFPNARLVVQRAEWEGLRRPHPLQSRWYQPDTFADLDHERVVVVDGDHLLGPGVGLVATPGHTAGNQSLVLHLDDGVHVVSGNGVLAECWAAGSSRLRGLRRYALDTGLDVVPRASTLEFAAWQHTSMVAEAVLADRDGDGRFPLVQPTGELTPHLLAPLVRPTVVRGGLSHGTVLPSRATDVRSAR